MPIFRFNISSQLFEQIPGDLESISVSVSDIGIEHVWGLTRDSEIFRWAGNPKDGQSFKQVPGRLASITLHVTAGKEEAEVWGLDEHPENNILRFSESAQIFLPIPGKLKVIANGGRGNIWGLNQNSDIFRFKESRQLFERVPGKLTSIATTGSFFASSTAFGINQNSDIFRFKESRQLFEQVPGKLVSISAKNEEVWGLNGFSEIFQGPTFAPIPGKLTSISVDRGGTVWGLHQTDIFRFNESRQLFEQVRDVHDRKLTRISVGASKPASIPDPNVVVSVWGLFNLSQKGVPTAPSGPSP